MRGENQGGDLVAPGRRESIRFLFTSLGNVPNCSLKLFVK